MEEPPLLLSEKINQSGNDDQGILGFLQENILTEQRRSNYRQCYYCKEFGASLGCASKLCTRKFHLPCGINKNIQCNFKHFICYCHLHRRRHHIPSRIKNDINTYNCVICMEAHNANDIQKIIWADCCKADIVLHRNCVQKLALSAGYFTKCPGCNNATEFVNTIKLQGVFVPERDASWELEPNYYEDINNDHITCDVVICKNPNGRSHSTTRGKWKYYLCKYCGSYGTHQNCSLVKRDFACPDCSCNETRLEPTSILQNRHISKLEGNSLNQIMNPQTSSNFELRESSTSMENKDYCNKDFNLIEVTVTDSEAGNGEEHNLRFGSEEMEKMLSVNFNLEESILEDELLTKNGQTECATEIAWLPESRYTRCHKVLKSTPVLSPASKRKLSNLETPNMKQVSCGKQANQDKWCRLNGIIQKLQERCKDSISSLQKQ